MTISWAMYENKKFSCLHVVDDDGINNVFQRTILFFVYGLMSSTKRLKLLLFVEYGLKFLVFHQNK